jgi:putative oxidoreductase
MLTSIGILILRLVIGLFVAAHGAQKLLGWFGGGGFSGTTRMMEAQGFRPNWLWALLASVGEFGGGLLLALGLLTPLAAAAIIGVMLMAVLKVHLSKGFWNSKGGLEFPTTLGVVAFVIGLIGPGSYAIDTLIGLALAWPLYLLLVLIAIVVVLGGYVASNQVLSHKAREQQPAV